MKPSTPILCALAIAIAGCKVGPDYSRPAIESPTTFRSQETPTTQQSLGDLPWWQVFNDPTLQNLIAVALANNYDVRIAATRIEQARAQEIQARSGLFPQVGYDGIAARGRNATLGQPRPAIEVPRIGTVGDNADDSYLATLGATWEVDLWGRIRRLDEAARAQLLATEEGQRGVMLSLTSSVARIYFELLTLDEQVQIAHSAVANYSHSLDLFEQRFERGAASKLETSRAQASLATAAADIPELQRQIILKENQLSLLLGQAPGPILHRTTLQQQVTPPTIPVGLPAQLLDRRPDIRQAEQQLRAANAQIGVAKAQFLPAISLTGLYGGASTDLSSLATSGARTWSVAANVTGPIFQGGRLSGQLQQAKAAWEEAKLNYEQTALTALREVADALASHQKLQQVIAEQARAVDAESLSVKLALDRYNTGKSAYYEVLDAQDKLFRSQTSLVQTRLNQLTTFVQLYKALGGGWELPESSDLPPATQPATYPTTQSIAAAYCAEPGLRVIWTCNDQDALRYVRCSPSSRTLSGS